MSADTAINQRIFENSLDLILVVSRSGDIIRVSPSSEAILGYRPEEMAGQSALKFIHLGDLERTRSEMRQARMGRETRNFDCRYLHKDGRVVQLTWTGVWSEAEAQHFFIGRDMTQRIAAEVKAALAEQLEATNAELSRTNRDLKEMQAQLIQTVKMASLGELTAGIAHEINNPLAFVMNHTNTVADRLRQIAHEVQPALTDQSRQKWDKALARLQDISAGLERMREIIVKLRTFSRLDEGEFKTVDVHENIDSTISMIQHRCKDRIDIRRRYTDDGTLACYPGPLNQVVMNLLSNAIDAIEREGVIDVCTRRSDSVFEITIADTGNGILPEIRGRVFDPFFTTKPVGSGTGLGLAISYRIVESHRGEIELGDREGGGTEVTLRIPVDLAREQQG